ncbi:MAG: nucleoside kinase [Coprococcus sp.]|nr:nucleoside kinase [Coprococcus sp.]
MDNNIPKSSVVSLKETAKEWAKKVNIDSVEKLNKMILSGKALELILICEAMQQNAIYEIARNIVKNNKRIVLIAGPSSAGKTTFSHRLSIQLRAMGMIPHAIAADNYFVNREDNPKDENGNYDFECLGAMDLKLLNNDVTGLLEGNRVELPEFNFKTGRREYHGNYLQIGEMDVLIMEGIHSLNPEMTYRLNENDKYKIYISPLNQLYIDDETKVSTLDSRLLRRMVRDNRARGNDVEKTLSMWNSVRSGEEKYIFPYESEADAMFNSGLLYEYAAIKPYALPLLESISALAEYEADVLRLKTFLNRFEELDTEYIPLNSILREFIGGGCFKV